MDSGGEGPPPGPVTCGQPTEITKKLMIGPGSFDLVLDSRGTPSLVWVDFEGGVHVANKDPKSTSWPSQGIAYPKVKTTTAAAAINKKDHLHVIYPGKSAGSAKVSLWHDFMDLKKTPFKWTGAKEIEQIDLAEVDLTSDPSLTSSVYLAASEKPGTGAVARMAVGRLDWSSNGYSYAAVCKQTTSRTYRAPRIAMGKLLGSDAYVAFSFHESQQGIWNVASTKVGDNSCPTLYSITGVARTSPVALSFDYLGNVQLAYSPPGTSPRGLGTLSHGIWATGAAPSNCKPVSNNEIIDPMSVDIAIRGTEPCIAHWEYVASPPGTHLKVICKNGPTNWGSSANIDTIKLDDKLYKGYQTRLVVDRSLKKLHLAYMVHKEQSGAPQASLRYVTCP